MTCPGRVVWTKNNRLERWNMMMQIGDVMYRFVWVNGHVEVYDDRGRFCFSADNRREALEELTEAA